MKSWSTPAPPAVPSRPDRLRLHDTATGRTRHPGNDAQRASLYVCGITPYDATHLGHASTYVAFDLLHRYWRAAGLEVAYVQNVTDVDDPLLERAEATGVDWRALAEEQTDLFRADMAALEVLAPDHYVGATEAVGLVVDAVETMLAAGRAYRVPGGDGEPDGDVYFDVRAAQSATDWRLGQVSAMGLDEMAAVFPERGGDPDRPGKRDPLDPLLWRVHREGEPAWDGRSLGSGRPGWHIECSVISRAHLPAPFTVQGGGSDLAFPHHEFSAAHAEAALEVDRMASHYVHAGMIALDGVKMSKSLGNLVFVHKLSEQGHDPSAIRLAVFAGHYRTDRDFSDAILDEAEARLARWREQLGGEASEAEAIAVVDELRAHLANDLDTPRALTLIDGVTGDHDRIIATALDGLLGVRI